MTWTPEATTRARVVAGELVGGQYDAGIDGEPLVLDWSGEDGGSSFGTAGYQQVSEETGIDQTSTSDDISENKLSQNEFWRSIRDWQGGFGQKRYDVPKVSAANAYRESWNADPRVPGTLSLQRVTTVAAPSTFSINTTTGGASDQTSDGFWFISESNIGAATSQAVTHYDFTTFTTKTRSGDSFRDIAVGPNGTCYVACDDGVYSCTKSTGLAQWSAQDLMRICAAKQRLFGISWEGSGGTGTTAIYEIPTEGGAPVAATSKLTLAPGTWAYDIKEAGALVLFAVGPHQEIAQSIDNNPVGAGTLYAYDGTNAPYRALTMPIGEVITAIHPALGGSLVLLFVRRQDANGGVRGVIYTCQVSGTSIANPQIAFEYPASYSDQFVLEAVSFGRFVYFPSGYDAATGLGLGLDSYSLAEGTVAHHLMPPTVSTNRPQAVTMYNGRLVWTQQQSSARKLIIESATNYVASGRFETSVIDLNVDAPKTWTTIEAGCDPLTSGQQIDIYWTAANPADGDWHLAGRLHPGQASQSFPLTTSSARIALRAELSTTTTTTTPTLTKLGVAAQMARLPKMTHHLKINGHPDQLLPNDQRMPGAGPDYFWRLVNRLEGLRDAGEVVWFQSPLSRFDGHAERVKVGAVLKRLGSNPSTGFGGVIAVALHNVDPDRRNLWPLSIASHPSLPVTLTASSVFEAVGGATVGLSSSGVSWTHGPLPAPPRVTPLAVGDGVRGPAAHSTVAWTPLLGRGLPLSASALIRPTADNLKVTISLEARTSADSIVQTDTSPTYTFGTGSAGQWLPVAVENVNYDSLTNTTVYLTAKILVASGSAITTFDIDGWQLEQSRIATRWVAPPSNY